MRIKGNIRSHGDIHPAAILGRSWRLWHTKLRFPLVFTKLLVIADLRPGRRSPYWVLTRHPSVLTLACQSGSVTDCVDALSPNSLIIMGAVPSYRHATTGPVVIRAETGKFQPTLIVPLSCCQTVYSEQDPAHFAKTEYAPREYPHSAVGDPRPMYSVPPYYFGRLKRYIPVAGRRCITKTGRLKSPPGQTQHGDH